MGEELKDEYSIVEYTSDHSGYKCGYCKSKDTNFSHGMWAHSLAACDYQALINRGWRRSGKYCYKPTMNKTCCPHYTIRCDAMKFKPTKSQKKNLKRMNKFLSFGKAEDHIGSEFQQNTSESDNLHGNMEQVQPPIDFRKNLSAPITNADDEAKLVRPVVSSSEMKSSEEQMKSCSSSVQIFKKAGQESRLGLDPSKPPSKKAKFLRRQNRENKKDVLRQKSKPKNAEKSLEDFINETLTDNPAHRLEVRLVPSSTKNEAFQSRFEDSVLLYQKYQLTIHKDSLEKSSRNKFIRFLCNSPMQNWKPAGGPSMGYGSFHQQYYLDDELIAVGVIDIMPNCLSSVYLYYDPKYSFLSLGTYSSLRELAMVRELQGSCPDLKWYYMGYYIHSCPKMTYKGKYSESYLLCPEMFSWQPINKCVPKLDVQKYSKLDEEQDRAQEELDYGKVLCLLNGNIIPYKIYKRIMSRDTENDVKEYCQFVGANLAHSMLLCRD